MTENKRKDTKIITRTQLETGRKRGRILGLNICRAVFCKLAEQDISDFVPPRVSRIYRPVLEEDKLSK